MAVLSRDLSKLLAEVVQRVPPPDKHEMAAAVADIEANAGDHMTVIHDIDDPGVPELARMVLQRLIDQSGVMKEADNGR